MRVLVVEDDTRIAADVGAALGASGFRVETCADGEEAWFLGDTEEYDLVVLDLGLPRLDGLTVLKRWRANGREMPVLVLTARGAWTERVEGIDAGAERVRAEELVERKLRREVLGDGDDAKVMRRLVGMLARRGYSQSMAVAVVGDALAAERERRRV